MTYGYEINVFYFRISLLLMSNKTVAEGFKNTGAEDTIKLAEQTPRPRFIKCHLPVDLLPKQLFEKKPKVSYYLIHVHFLVGKHYPSLNGGFTALSLDRKCAVR